MVSEGLETGQLLEASRTNEAENQPIDILYGCSTTGIEWRFIQFQRDEISIDERRYLLRGLPELLGALQAIMSQGKPTVAH